MATFPLTTPVADQQYEMRQTFAGEFVFVKNAYGAWLLDDTGASPITDTDYPGYQTIAVTSITRTLQVATVTTAAPNALETGDTVLISGATQPEYNGLFTITVLTASTFTYVVTGTPATPATGTIVLQGGKTTVPGIVYLNDYIFVGTVKGEIQNCNRSAYTVWDALDFITPEKEPSLLVCIAKSLNFLVAFKQWDTEFFYDGEVPPPGSPLLPQDSAYLKLGCASAGSVVEFDGGIILMTQRDQLQRSREVHVFNGLTPQKISSPEVERLLNEDDLATVYSLYLSTAGHQFFVLTLVTTGITMVCDMAQGKNGWSLWTSLSEQSTQPVLSMSRSGRTVTVTVANHGFEDGDPVEISGASPDAYNGIFNIRLVDDNVFTYLVDGAPSTPATGTITAMGYDESYLDAVAYATFQNLDVTLAQTTGVIYALDRTQYQDTGIPINVTLRTANWDGGSDNKKSATFVRPIGDRIDASVLVRWNDDDYEPDSWERYRPVDMSEARPQTSGLGSTVRRAYEVRYTDNTELRLEALETRDATGYT